MAEVYRAKPFNVPDVDRYLAVKRILPNLAEDDEFVSMFVDEAKIAIRLNHPNICKIYELGRLATSHYIVMEFIAGQDILNIQKRLRQKRRVMAVGQAVYIAARVADALDHAHAQKDDDGVPLQIVHRDVSPQNILISYAGDVKLIDFGIAKVATQSTETRVGVLKGKFSYMSPEQVRGHNVDSRSDLFALGTMLYEMLTGRRLFHGESDFHTLEQVRAARIEAPSLLNKMIPSELDEIVLQALAREPADRFQSGTSMSRALEGFLETAGAPYDKPDLSAWVVENFPSELDAERRARERFKEFVTPDDVRRHNEKQIEALRDVMGSAAAQPGKPNLGTEDITQVATPELSGFTAEVGAEEIIAENIVEPLPARIARAKAEPLADIDLPEPEEPEHDSAMFRPQERRSLSFAVAIPVLLVIALVVAVILVGQGDDPVPPLTSGMMIIEVEPSDQLLVFLDGRLVETSSPTILRNIPSGPHEIEVRHESYETYIGEVLLESGTAPTIAIELSALPTDPGWLRITVDPRDAQVWLDGTQIQLDDSDTVLEVESREPHLLEARKPGFFVAEQTLWLVAGEERTADIQLVPVEATLVLASDPPGIAYLDDVEIGTTEHGLVATRIDPHIPHSLRIEPAEPGFLFHESTILFEAVTELTRYAALRRLGETPAVDQVRVGYLAIETPNNWYRVLLDGRDTGLTTPITAGEPLALRAGDRRIGLVRGAQQFDLLVPVTADQITAVNCGSEDWDCGVP